jgi:signal transduction histidine kinase/ActR/RegA family two-component response regulator
VTSVDDPGDPGRASRLLTEVQALAHLGVWEWDAARRQLHWSDETYRILGLAPGEVEPSFEVLLARVHADDAADVRQHLSRARREPGPLALEYRIVRPTGEVRTLQARTQSTFDAAGALVRIIGTEQDLTDTKDLAARLVFSDRMISVGTLAGGMAHEINNPLATISAYLDLLVEYPEARESDTLVGEARAAIDRIRNIMRGLAAFSRADHDLRGPLEVERVLELAIGMAGNEIRHRARLIKDYRETPPVHANEARLGHVFLNLLVNAAEAIPEGQADRHEIQVSTRTDAAGWLVVEIRDSGAGIAREIQDRIFDPFFTTKQVGKGTGLGLSISHGIVRSLGGEIMLRSEVGRGSTFSVSLPPSKEAPRVPPAAPPPAPDPAGSEHRGHVLIVDDEVAFANSLRRLLSNEHAVSIVANGREALARIQDGERFDVILCDLMMPEMTGSDLYRALIEKAPDQANRIIFITGGAFSPTSQLFLEQVPNHCFEKPCDIQKLRSAIRLQITSIQS